jgi:hypothetical protein
VKNIFTLNTFHEKFKSHHLLVVKIFEPYEVAILPLRCCSGSVLFYGALNVYRLERALRRKAAGGNTP